MYFASAEEQRYVQRGLLPEVRRQPVADELRGWNWDRPPLKPIYAERLGVYEVAGKYCPSGRDLYLRRVRGMRAEATRGMREGRVLHEAVAELITRAKRLIYLHGAGCVPHLARMSDPFDRHADGDFLPQGEAPGPEQEDGYLLHRKEKILRAFETRRIVERVEDVLARQPFAGPDALASLALPVNVEVKLDGRYLGLSEHLSADAIAAREAMVLDLKFGPREPFHRLTTTGYALVLEALYETPVDVGCVVYVRFVDGRIVVERDFHVIGDEQRQMFVEERDEKMRLAAEEIDPGLPGRCPSSCPYLGTCHPAVSAQPDERENPASANLAVGHVELTAVGS